MKLSNKVQVSIVTAGCLLALAYVSRKILNADLDPISLYAPVWIYFAYTGRKNGDNPLYWSAAIIFVTVAILGVYTL